MITNFAQLPKALDKFVTDSQKKMRLASYNTLGQLARLSRQQIIADYPKQFPDENGIRKNRGVPKQVFFDNRVDKSIPNNPSIRIYANDKISFMEKQEFGGTLTGGSVGSSAAVPFTESLKTMRSGTKGMKDKFSVRSVMTAAKNVVGSTLKGNRKGNRKPQPFFMETRSGHTMVAIREGKKRLPVIPLYHFDQKRTFRKRWDFFKTVEGVVVSMTERVWGEQLKKALDRK